MEIIIRKSGSSDRTKVVIDPRHVTPAQLARMRVSRENRQEYDNEKRAKELSRKMKDSCQDYNAVAVAKMMGIDEHKAKKLINCFADCIGSPRNCFGLMFSYTAPGRGDIKPEGAGFSKSAPCFYATAAITGMPRSR